MRQAGMEDLAEMLEKQLASELSKMTLEEALPLARAFSHHLTLMGIAETHHRVRKGGNMVLAAKGNMVLAAKSCDDIFNNLLQDGVSPVELYKTVFKQEVEIVLTAHPTQINHRTLQYKHLKIAVGEKTSIWQTDELRRSKPTPVDEARAAVPHYLRRVSSALKKHTGKPLPLTCTPIKFGSWMGGDRDGNPNVTAKVTKDVSLLSRWMAIDLYIREVDGLRFELSMNQCSDKLSELAHEILKEGNDEEDHHEHWNGSMSRSQSKHPNQQASPLPTKLPAGAHIPSCAWPVSMTYSPSFNSSQLVAQRKLFAESQIGRTSFQRLLEPNSDSYRHGPSKHDPMDYYETKYQLLEPLLLCYESLQLCGSGVLADGRLADLIRRVATFGMVLMKLDLRQESSRHAETIDAITRYLDMGTYSEWDEEKKLDFLTRELKGKRPLVPPSIEVRLLYIGGCQGDKRTDEAQTPTILINPDEGGEYWCNETWVGMLKKVMEVETLEDRITWELGYNVRTKFLGDDMVLLPGMSDDKAQLLIQSETESDDSLFYSLEKWTPKCRPNNRVVWLQLWGFLIQVWEMKNLRRDVAAIGDVIESDDDTEDRRRLDRARVLVRTPLPPLIRSEVIVRVGELEYRVWIVEETGFEGGSNRKGSSPSDGWSEMITSDDEGELPNQKLSPSRTQRAEGGTDVRCCDLRPLGNIQADVTPKEKSKGTVEGMLGSSFGKLNLGDSFAGTEEEAANTKEVTCYNTLHDDRRHRNHIEGKYLNGGAKVAADQTFIGEEEGHVTQSLSPSLSGQIQQGIGPGCIKGPISTQGGCNKEDIHPVELLGVQAVQNQKEGGLSNDLGPILKTDGCHKEESLPVIQSIKENPDKYSKVYFRQQNSLFKARLSQIEEKHPQFQDGILALADQLANQDKVKNQSYVDSKRRLKSIIECSDKVLQEAQQLWHLGENLGMETVTDNLHFLHSYASMECRDRKEAKELGNRKPHK
uniref:Uncharacterized protein n=1 Tax=Glycine max TaxID=3847 RepID=A0A0R0L3L0_SOYBN